jgi:hypothetical protein
MKLKPLIFLAVAIGLYAVSHSLELRGDAAPFGEHGVSPERAKYHAMALILLVGALGCFIAAAVTAFRGKDR